MTDHPKHLSEDELILNYYGEDVSEAELRSKHLSRCEQCQEELAQLRRDLDGLGQGSDLDREPPNELAERAWSAVRPALESGGGAVADTPRGTRPASRYRWLALAAAVLIGTFFLGRVSNRSSSSLSSSFSSSDGRSKAAVGETVLLVALSDHLERTQWVLLEVANDPSQEGWPIDPRLASELVQESRLYRQTADRLGDVATAEVLEELERVLLDVAQGPQSTDALTALQARLVESDLLFKVRVLKTSVRNRQAGAATRRF